MKEVTKSGRTVEEALNTALGELQVTKDQVDYQVVEEAKKGIFGLGSKPATVLVKLKEKVSKEKSPKINDQDKSLHEQDHLEEAHAFLKSVTEKMGAPVEIVKERDDHGVTFKLSGEKIGILIGKRGNTLNALQYLVNIAGNRHSGGHVHIMLDAENYRARRKEALEQLASRLADKAKYTGRNVFLDPMPSMERKIIHLTLQDVEGISTYSDGTDPNRRVVITPDKTQ